MSLREKESLFIIMNIIHIYRFKLLEKPSSIVFGFFFVSWYKTRLYLLEIMSF